MKIERLYELFRKAGRVTTDSRSCPEGSMFFALKGASFDGNQYAAAALEKGCRWAVVEDRSVCVEGDDRYVPVDDVLRTLQLLARHHRRAMGTTILGITGTNGKTTTKELTAAVLGRRFNLLYTEGNLNNHIGVPLTLLRLREDHEMAVIEMGASHPGDIKELVDICEPDYGLITNVGKAHLLGFGSFEGVKRTKGELYDYLRENGGKAFVNQNDADLTAMAEGLERIDYVEGKAVGGNTMLTCSISLHASRSTLHASRFTLHELKTHLIGDYNLPNVLAAATVGQYFGVEDEDICKALADYIPSNNRSQLMQTAHNTLIVDAYNANPTSMALAIDNFSRMQAGGKLCILGMMGELGESSAQEHQRVVDRLVEKGLADVWLVGSEFLATSHPTTFRMFADVEEVKSYLKEFPLHNRTILVKGSNSTRLYQLPQWL